MKNLTFVVLCFFLHSSLCFGAKSISPEEGSKLMVRSRCDIFVSFTPYGGHENFDLKGKVLGRINRIPKVSIREFYTWKEGRGQKEAYCLILVDNPKTNAIFEDLKKIIPEYSRTGATVLQTNTGKSWRTKMP